MSAAGGGLLGTLAVDVARIAFGSPVPAYTLVFMGEAAMFILAAILAAAVARRQNQSSSEIQLPDFDKSMERAK